MRILFLRDVIIFFYFVRLFYLSSRSILHYFFLHFPSDSIFTNNRGNFKLERGYKKITGHKFLDSTMYFRLLNFYSNFIYIYIWNVIQGINTRGGLIQSYFLFSYLFLSLLFSFSLKISNFSKVERSVTIPFPIYFQ